METAIWLGWGLVNCLGFILMGIDKGRAKKGSPRRIPERTLLGLAALGGAPGVYLGLKYFRHKTLHRSFTFGLPTLILIQAALAVLLANYC